MNKALVGAVAALAAALSSIVTILVQNEVEESGAITIHYMTEEQVKDRLRLELRPIEQSLEITTKTNEALAIQLGRATEKIQQLEVRMSELIGTVEREGRRGR